MLTPEERVLRARIAANTRWSREADRAKATENARRASNDRFLNQVPAEITDPVQRAKCAENLRKAFYQRMAFKSAQVRRRKGRAASGMPDALPMPPITTAPDDSAGAA